LNKFYFLFLQTGAQADPQEGSQGNLQGHPPPGSQAGKAVFTQASCLKAVQNIDFAVVFRTLVKKIIIKILLKTATKSS
jgi:hypothetical protein